MEPENQLGCLLGRPITRRTAIKAGGIAAVGLAFSKPIIETIHPRPAFAQLSPVTTPPRLCVDPPTGMVGWWPGDGNANDIIGGNNGILQNGATFATGMVGQAFSLNGTNHFVQVPHNASINLGGDYTVDAWIQPTIGSGQFHMIANKRADSDFTTPLLLFVENRGSASGFASLTGNTSLDNALVFSIGNGTTAMAVAANNALVSGQNRLLRGPEQLLLQPQPGYMTRNHLLIHVGVSHISGYVGTDTRSWKRRLLR